MQRKLQKFSLLSLIKNDVKRCMTMRVSIQGSAILFHFILIEQFDKPFVLDLFISFHQNCVFIYDVSTSGDFAPHFKLDFLFFFFFYFALFSGGRKKTFLISFVLI